MVLALCLLTRLASAEPTDKTGPREILVTGERPMLDHSRAEPSVASTVLSGDALHRAGQTTEDVLARVPGVQVLRTGAQSDVATASIRGSDSAQVPVYLAGIRINDEVSGVADLSTLPLWMIDRIEVFRGNAPEAADRLGMGGAMFFWPKLPRATRLGVSAQAGSFGEGGAWLAYEAGSEKAGSLVAVRRAQAENAYPFLNDSGQRFDLNEREERRKNAEFVAHDAWVVARFAPSPEARLTLVVHALEREQGVTGLSVIPAESARATVRRLLSGISARVPCSLGEGCRVELQASFLKGSLTLSDPFVELPALRTRSLHGAGTRQNYAIRGTTSVTPNLKLALSATQSFDELDITRLANLPRSAKRITSRLAGTAVLRLGRLSLHALASAECHTTRGTDERFGNAIRVDSGRCGLFAPSGRLGARVGLLPGLELLANAGRYVRVPTLGELYGTSPIVDGNSKLEAERGVTADAGVRVTTKLPRRVGSIALESFAFARFADNLIRFRRTSLSTEAPYNVSSARSLGVETALGAELFDTLRLEASGTLLDPRETTGGVEDSTENDLLPLDSRLVASARLEAFTRPRWADRVGLALAYFYRSSRFADPAGQIVLPPQSLFDLEASSAHLGGRLLARLAVRNVLDSRRLDLLGLPIPGRSLHGELEAWF